MPTATSERWVNDGMNIKAKLETLGYEVDLQYAGDDIDLQVSQIESMIRNDVSCLVIASIDSTKLVDVLEQAKKNRIPVIAYDRLLMDTDAVSYYATFDNKAVGTLIGEYIIEKKHLKEASKAGKSYTIEFFMGSPDDNNALFLYNGVMECLAPYLEDGTLVCRSGRTSFEDTCILRWSEDKAKQICDDLIRNYYPGGGLDIACSAFDGFAYGILSACDVRGLTGDKLPLITGQDAEKTAIRNIAGHKQTMTIYKDTRVLASKCVTMVQALLENGMPEINDTGQYNNHVLTVPSYLCDPLVIDESNYEQILIGGGYYTREQLFD
ncbi:MAG: sugar-binding protein [Lachnospiraceae bacterium]|nr:sugar-binding protein [Lachnospiraceae bacterium]